MVNDVLLPARMTALVSDIGARKSRIRKRLDASAIPIIDVFHGEMRFSMHPNVQRRIVDVTRALVDHSADFRDEDGALYSKTQPAILRRLAADKLFAPLRRAGIDVDPKDVLVCPYSSLVMLEAALAAVARPGGIVLCPRGFYKSNAIHVGKFGLQIRTFPVDVDRDGRVDARLLRRAIRQHREDLCAVLLTLPGNPLVAEYTDQELEAIGRVLLETGARVIIDAAFDGVQADARPLPAATLRSHGRIFRLHDRCVTVTGTSKSHHAVGPYKIGAAVTGDATWRAAITKELTIPFQRETTALARVVLEETPDAMLEDNRRIMMERQAEARERCAKIAERFGPGAVSYLGSSQYGPFMMLTIREDILTRAGIEDGWQLADALFAAAHLDVVAGPRMGFQKPCVRINIDAPRIGGVKDPALFEEVFRRIEAFVEAIVDRGLTYRAALDRIGEPDAVDLRAWLRTSQSIRPTKVAVPRETGEGEARVALTPQAAATLVGQGFEVAVEASAGARSGFTDEEYVRAGAAVAESKESLYRGASIVTWVKPPADLAGELSRMPKGAAILGFMNPFGKKSVLPALEHAGLRAFALELLPDRLALSPSMDALAAMSRFAGRIALEEAVALRARLGARAPHKVLVLGAGQAGLAAARAASMAGYELLCASTSALRQEEIEEELGGSFIALPDERTQGEAASAEQRRTLREIMRAHRPTIVICTARRSGSNAPKLLTERDLALLPESSVVVDLTAAAGGNVEPVAVNEALCTSCGVWVCNKSNYPSAEPRQASAALASCLAEILIEHDLAERHDEQDGEGRAELVRSHRAASPRTSASPPAAQPISD